MPLSTLIKKLFFRSVGILDLISRTSCPSPPLHAEHCNYAVSTKRMVKTICIPKKYHNPNAHFNIIIKIQSRAQKSKSAFRAIQSNRENSKITNVHLATILNLAKTTTRRQRWFVLMKAETKKQEPGTIRRRSSYNRSLRKDNRQLFSMCVPGIILLALFAYLPMFGLVLAFKNYKFNLGIFGNLI